MSQGGSTGSGSTGSGLRRALRAITRPTVDNGGSDGRNQGMDQGMTALASLISGVLLWGGAGWFADRVLHTSFLVGIGIVIGAGLGIYLVIARFSPRATPAPGTVRPDHPESEPGEAGVGAARPTDHEEETR